MSTQEKISQAMQDAERKAWTSLAGYKFWMFGYHAAAWVQLNRLAAVSQGSPFKNLVKFAANEVRIQKVRTAATTVTSSGTGRRAGVGRPEPPGAGERDPGRRGALD